MAAGIELLQSNVWPLALTETENPSSPFVSAARLQLVTVWTSTPRMKGASCTGVRCQEAMINRRYLMCCSENRWFLEATYYSACIIEIHFHTFSWQTKAIRSVYLHDKSRITTTQQLWRLCICYYQLEIKHSEKTKGIEWQIFFLAFVSVLDFVFQWKCNNNCLWPIKNFYRREKNITVPSVNKKYYWGKMEDYYLHTEGNKKVYRTRL